MKRLGANIKQLRIDLGLSQIELSNQLGVSQTSVAHYEKGTRQPSIETLIQMSYLFDVSMDTLMGVESRRLYDSSIDEIVEKIPELTEYLLTKNGQQFLQYFRDYVENQYSIEDILYKLLQPILYKIGTLWEKGKINEGDEHYATNIIRKVLNHLSYRKTDSIHKSNVVSFAISSEKHTIGIEMVNLYLESLGLNTIYLGSNVPQNAIIEVLENNQPQYVFISVTLDVYLNSLSRLIHALVSQFGDKLTIVIGGQGVTHNKYNVENKNVLIVRNNQDIKEIIKR